MLISGRPVPVVIASIGYTPVPGRKDVIDKSKSDFTKVRLSRGKMPPGPDFQRFNYTVDVKDFKENKPASNPANGIYEFTLVVTPGEADEPILGAGGRKKDRAKDKEKDGERVRTRRARTARRRRTASTISTHSGKRSSFGTPTWAS